MVSTKGRYALRVMIDLANYEPNEYVPLKEITKRQNISAKYLESIISVLVKEGFVVGLRGKGGGYKLTKRPDEYTVGSILKRRKAVSHRLPVWKPGPEFVRVQQNARHCQCGRIWSR